MAPGSPPDDPVRGLVSCFIPPRMLQSGASFCRILSVASDAPVRGTGFTPGRSSPGARAELHSAPDAPIRGVMYLSLFADVSVCVCGALANSLFVFFRAPIVVAPPPLPPLRFAFPSTLSAPAPPPFLSSPAPFHSLCGGFAGARTQAPSFFARMLLCFGAGTHVHSSSFFPACSLFSCFVPLHVPSFVACTLCCLCLPRVLSSSVCLRARTQAATPTHAVCHHSHLSFNQSFCTLAARYLCVTPRVDTVGNAAANSPLAFQPKVSGILSCLTYSSRLGLFVFGVVLD